VNDYLLTHRIENFGAFPEVSATYRPLIGHLPDHEINSARISFAGNTHPNANLESFMEFDIYQTDQGGEAEAGTVYIARSGRIIEPVRSGQSIHLELQRGAPFYMGALFMEIQTKHVPGGGLNAPWKGIGDMVLTLHMRQKRAKGTYNELLP